ncbi:MAG: hypothetical protein L0K86_12440 [Actinomycetia bacterium]|nr:hypothetical protein [Actinomycetes bacterium]
MFNSPHINEMMARETMEYRAAEFENSRRRQLVRAARTANRANSADEQLGRRFIARLLHASRRPA